MTATAFDLETDPLGELRVPLAQRFVTHGDTAFTQDFLHSSQAEIEAVEQPQGVVDDGGREAIPSVPSGVGQVSGHYLEPTLSSQS